jgi:hypothetical protein
MPVSPDEFFKLYFSAYLFKEIAAENNRYIRKNLYNMNLQSAKLPTLSHQAVPYLKRLVAGFPLQQPRFASRQHVGFVVDKTALGQIFSEYFGFPCQSFHQFLHHNHPGLAQ